MVIPQGAVGWSAVCDCGIPLSHISFLMAVRQDVLKSFIKFYQYEIGN